MNKYRAVKWFDEYENREKYGVERTHSVYGWPAIEIPKQPKFQTYQQAQEYAKKLNGEAQQLKLF